MLRNLKKTSVLKSLFNRVTGLLQIYAKETPVEILLFEFCKIFKNTYNVKLFKKFL